MEILLNYSKYITVLTGAGVSTYSGIPDFRGKGTSSETRPDMSKFNPSPLHTILADLVNRGIIKHIVSQNIDDLHLKSGVPENKLSELHGNMMKEKCDGCHTVIRHDTQITDKRPCICGGTFSCTLVNFHDILDPIVFEKAKEEMKKTDLLIVMGTSLKVAPANTLPQIVSRAGMNIVVINNEPTDLDVLARIVYHNDILTVLTDIYNHVTKDTNLEITPTISNGFLVNFKRIEPWNCDKCTFLNRMRMNECEICEINRFS